MSDSALYRAPQNQFPAIAALFLGPKAENSDMLTELLKGIVVLQKEARQKYHVEDPDFISVETKNSAVFKDTQEKINYNIELLLRQLGDKSIPFYSPRYSGHMGVDQSLPAILAYFSTMFYNPNNVAFEASPLTSLIEAKCGLQLCKMVGYPVPEDFEISRADGSLSAWGHITSGGTVANLESMWAARNLKFYPLSLKEAIQDELFLVRDKLRVKTCSGEDKLFNDCNTWELLNLDAATILDLPQQVAAISYSSVYIETCMKKYIIQTTGKDTLKAKYGVKHEPVVFASSTKHYSWPKAAAVLGIGSDNLRNIKVDTDARMSIAHLREELKQCLENHIPVYQVVSVIGTTEEGSIDRVKDVLALREEFRQLGLTFLVHADAAWGGYFATMLDHDKIDTVDSGAGISLQAGFVPHVGLRKDSAEQLAYLRLTDSITIDPHKAGYVPYPAGALCHRDKRMKQLVTWIAPYIDGGSEDDTNIGSYGIEGSKPGAAPVAAFIAHETIGLTASGYGELLGEAMYACRRYAAHWSAMSTEQTSFTVTPFNKIPAELNPESTPADIEAQKLYIRKNILFKSNTDIAQNKDAMEILNALGSDLNINIFACNFRHRNNTLNTNVRAANDLNTAIVKRLSVTKPGQNPLSVPFYLTSTVFKQEEYGECATEMKRRMGLEGEEDLVVLRNVVMSPFTTINNFIDTLIHAFQEVVEEEVENAREREHNGQQKITHKFVFHGFNNSDERKGYLVYIPCPGSFHQIVISIKYSKLELDTKDEEKEHPLIIQTNRKRYLHDVLASQSISGDLYIGDRSTGKTVLFTLNDIVINRALPLVGSTCYPTLMNFYIYGSKGSVYMSNIVTATPNVLLSAGNTTVKLESDLPEEELQSGKFFVSVSNIFEAAMHPLKQLPDGPVEFFQLNRELQVTVYRTSSGEPVISDSAKVTRGTITLTGRIYIDNTSLSTVAKAVDARSLTSAAHKPNWDKLVTEFHGGLKTITFYKD